MIRLQMRLTTVAMRSKHSNKMWHSLGERTAKFSTINDISVAAGCRFDPARCILRPVSVRRRCLASPTWNASVPFLVGGSSTDMNSVVTHFTKNVSLHIVAAEFPG